MTVWQTLLHILINVYWNKSGLIQTDATNDVVVKLLGVTNNRFYNDVFRTFTFPMQQSESFVSTRINIYNTHKNQDSSFNFRFQNWERTVDNRKDYLTTCGEFFFSFTYFFLITTRIRDFLLDIDSAYKSLVWTATIWLEISGCNSIVSILLLYLYYNLLFSGNFDDHRTLVRHAYILLLY